MQFLKTVLIVIAVIIVLAALIIVSMTYGLFQLGEAIVEQANEPVVQKIQTNNQEVTVTVALQEKRGLRYDPIALCTPERYEDDMDFKRIIVPEGFSTGYLCGNGLCSVWIEANQDAIPSYISMYVSEGGLCEQKRFETQGHEGVLKYEARIEFSDELLQALHINAPEYKVGATHCNEVSSWQVMGNKKAVFSYDSRRKGDELLIDGVPKASLKYE